MAAAVVLGALALVVGLLLSDDLLGIVLLFGGAVLLVVGAVAFSRGEMDVPHEALPPGSAAGADQSLDAPHGITRGLP